MQKHSQKHAHHAAGSTEDQRAELLREGEFYRSGLAHAKAQIKHAARPEVMFHSVVDHATWALRSRADALLKPTGANVSALAPYALTVLSFIRKRRLGKPALGLALLAGVAGWYVQRKRAQEQLAY
jgi:C4-dicarboxylate-specific signal transduction histidine kinase